jgi:hypothetical protein
MDLNLHHCRFRIFKNGDGITKIQDNKIMIYLPYYGTYQQVIMMNDGKKRKRHL